jgi:hypothetical protein
MPALGARGRCVGADFLPTALCVAMRAVLRRIVKLHLIFKHLAYPNAVPYSKPPQIATHTCHLTNETTVDLGASPLA